MQTTPRDIHALCITRIKSPDFGFPQTRRRRNKLPTIIGIAIFGLILVAYLVTTLLTGGAS